MPETLPQEAPWGIILCIFCKMFQKLKRLLHKMVKHTQTIRRQKIRQRIVWVCLTILWGWRLKNYNENG